jgi:hypothetical protein
MNCQPFTRRGFIRAGVGATIAVTPGVGVFSMLANAVAEPKHAVSIVKIKAMIEYTPEGKAKVGWTNAIQGGPTVLEQNSHLGNTGWTRVPIITPGRHEFSVAPNAKQFFRLRGCCASPACWRDVTPTFLSASSKAFLPPRTRGRETSQLAGWKAGVTNVSPTHPRGYS